MADGPDGFHNLVRNADRAMFVLYGTRSADGTRAANPYLKLAHSLNEALTDLRGNEGVDPGPYVVVDAFLRSDEGEPQIEVQLLHIDDVADLAERRG